MLQTPPAHKFTLFKFTPGPTQAIIYRYLLETCYAEGVNGGSGNNSLGVAAKEHHRDPPAGGHRGKLEL